MRDTAALAAGDMLAKAAEAARFLRSLGQEHRLAILCALIEQPCQVGELAARLGLAQPKVSQHLAILRAEGLVSATRSGTRQTYALANGTVATIVTALQGAFCPAPAMPPRQRKGTD
ncbi:ArsR family transcriptional regulator [Dongia mobilis]|uniref:ArsR family transcriptional regulator n=1 Tax=Dongia mobilis TaxID=578943 RepID=A0A4R6WWZ7_9PROT|nr:metalloregulator ArsR/SmtB family transcription factor [Dongia mobilis]TDQ82075.1 ArsR family transcriptional regulator [Dongia mobilis]